MTSVPVFVNITPEMRERILDRIRKAQGEVLQQLVDAGAMTPEEASAEARRLLQSETPYADAERLFQSRMPGGEKLQ